MCSVLICARTRKATSLSRGLHSQIWLGLSCLRPTALRAKPERRIEEIVGVIAITRPLMNRVQKLLTTQKISLKASKAEELSSSSQHHSCQMPASRTSRINANQQDFLSHSVKLDLYAFLDIYSPWFKLSKNISLEP